MKSFLSIAAQDLRQRCGSDLSRTAVVFPNKRAGLFFNEELAKEGDKPLWSPVYLTISELFRSLSPYTQADEIETVCTLHKIFCTHTKQEENIDNFYFWGEMLLHDFDDADKNLVATHSLFANLKELQQIDDKSDFLTDEQIQTLKQFFHHFSPQEETELKRRFLEIWGAMSSIYDDLHKSLQEQGIAYEGMLQREAVENFDTAKLRYDRFVFIGFNVLNRAEEELFKKIRESKETLFYWDYDTFYIDRPHHEAGRFLNRNLTLFPNTLQGADYSNLEKEKEVRFIAAPTDNSQARYLQQWLQEHPGGNEAAENAIILCDESLLQPVLHSIPPCYAQVLNVTMGFPFTQTAIYSYLQALINLQTEGYDERRRSFSYETVCSLLNHPYIRSYVPQALALEDKLVTKNRFFPTIDELHDGPILSHIFTHHSEPQELLQYLKISLQYIADDNHSADDDEKMESILFTESFYKAYTLLNRFSSLIEEEKLTLTTLTLCNLLNRVCTSATIPFQGEPIEGLQVMGLLETRNLDFKNIVMLSVNEGKLPQGGGESSFIPFNLRRAFGMTTIDNRDSLYCYYFYRLLQRAESITLLYNNANDNSGSRECSRFMLQYQVELPQKIDYRYLNAAQRAIVPGPITIEKSAHVMELLRERFRYSGNDRNRLSPTALNSYLDCPLKFFLRYIAKITPADEVSAEIDSGLFGTIFHEAAQKVYEDLASQSSGGQIQKSAIEELLHNNKAITSYVDRSFNHNFFHDKEESIPQYNGEQLINREVIKSYLKQLLQIDLNYAPFRYVAAEQNINYPLTIEVCGESLTICIGGTIDRLDAKGDTLNLVDYKTGGKVKNINELSDIFTPSDKRPAYFLQTFLYASVLLNHPVKGTDKLKISPALLYIHRAANTTREDAVISVAKEPVTDFEPYFQEFSSLLEQLLQDIYNPLISFSQTTIPSLCDKCDYKELCRK